MMKKFAKKPLVDKVFLTIGFMFIALFTLAIIIPIVYVLIASFMDPTVLQNKCGLCMKVTLKTILPLSGQGLHPSKKIISSRKLLPLL